MIVLESFGSESYELHFLLSSMYTCLVKRTWQSTIIITENWIATKFRCHQLVTGLLGAGRTVRQVCKFSIFPLLCCFINYFYPKQFIVCMSIFCSATLSCLDIHYIILFYSIGRQTRDVRCVRSDDLTPAGANCCGEDFKPDSENLCFE